MWPINTHPNNRTTYIQFQSTSSITAQSQPFHCPFHCLHQPHRELGWIPTKYPTSSIIYKSICTHTIIHTNAYTLSRTLTHTHTHTHTCTRTRILDPWTTDTLNIHLHHTHTTKWPAVTHPPSTHHHHVYTLLWDRINQQWTNAETHSYPLRSHSPSTDHPSSAHTNTDHHVCPPWIPHHTLILLIHKGRIECLMFTLISLILDGLSVGMNRASCTHAVDMMSTGFGVRYCIRCCVGRRW